MWRCFPGSTEFSLVDQPPGNLGESQTCCHSGFSDHYPGGGIFMHGTFVDIASSSLSSSSDPEPSSPVPFVVQQAPEGGGRLVPAAVLVPMLVAVMMPFWLVFLQLASDPAARAILADRPLLALELLTGLVVLFGIFGWPLLHLAPAGSSAAASRSTGSVGSESSGLFGSSSWTEPLAQYPGSRTASAPLFRGPARTGPGCTARRPARSVVLQCAAASPRRPFRPPRDFSRLPKYSGPERPLASRHCMGISALPSSNPG